MSDHKKNSNSVLLLRVGTVLVVALILGLMFKNRLLWKPHTDTYPEIICNFDTAGGPCQLPPAQVAIFSDKNLARYEYPLGVGVIQPFTKIINGKRYTKTFRLPGWKKYQEEKNNTKRTKIVEAKRAEFAEMAAWWTKRDPDNLKIDVFVDATGAIEEADIALISNNVGYRKIGEAVAAGDGLELVTCVVTDDPRAPYQRLIVKQGESHKAQEVQDRLSTLWVEHPEVPHTALIERLRSLFAEQHRARNMPNEVIIFSDGMQFFGGIDFYNAHRELLMNEEKWDELKKLVEPEGKSLVSLDGIKFTWFKPGRKMTPEESATIDQAIRFWASLFTDHGANVEVIME